MDLGALLVVEYPQAEYSEGIGWVGEKQTQINKYMSWEVGCKVSHTLATSYDVL